MSTINITEAAQAYLGELLKNQNTPGIGIRVFYYPAGYHLCRNLYRLLQT